MPSNQPADNSNVSELTDEEKAMIEADQNEFEEAKEEQEEDELFEVWKGRYEA